MHSNEDSKTKNFIEDLGPFELSKVKKTPQGILKLIF